jgi:hypothetical protein
MAKNLKTVKFVGSASRGKEEDLSPAEALATKSPQNPLFSSK